MSVANCRMGVTNRQLGSEGLIPLIAGVKKGLPARCLRKAELARKLMSVNPVKTTLDRKYNHLKMTNKIYKIHYKKITSEIW